MKSKVWFVFVFCLLILCLPKIYSQEPGTAGDPLISKSYLEQVYRFRSIVIPAGDKLPLNSGTMIVLRSGKVKLRAPRGKAIIDLTDGKEIPADSILPHFHLLLVADATEYFLEAQTMAFAVTAGLLPTK